MGIRSEVSNFHKFFWKLRTGFGHLHQSFDLLKIFQENKGRFWAYAHKFQSFTNFFENLIEFGHTPLIFEFLKIFQGKLGSIWAYAPELQIFIDVFENSDRIRAYALELRIFQNFQEN